MLCTVAAGRGDDESAERARAHPHPAATSIGGRQAGQHRQQHHGRVPLPAPSRTPARLLEQGLQLRDALVESTLVRVRRTGRGDNTHRVFDL